QSSATVDTANNAIYTLVTAANQLQVIPGVMHQFDAYFTAGNGFLDSTGTLTGGLMITPALLTISATANTKGYDKTTTAAAMPTVSGLVGTDSVYGQSQAYSDGNAGSSKML